jgi:hypothetical protein
MGMRSWVPCNYRVPAHNLEQVGAVPLQILLGKILIEEAITAIEFLAHFTKAT